jgi:hypothetical protein
MPSAKKTSTKTPNKSDFIRSQPATLSAAEVVAKAKTAGVTILPGLVYEVRRKAKGPAKGEAKRTTAAKPAPVTATRPATSTKPPKSKAAFVRGLPASTPAKDVVKQAKVLGLSLSVNYVYNIRGAAKVVATKKRAAAKTPIGSAVANIGSWSVSQHAETLLRAVAAELGVGHAIELLHAERARVHSILRE